MLQDAESGTTRKTAKKDTILTFISRIFLQSFTMTFLAEWGDRSQLTTIILGAREVYIKKIVLLLDFFFNIIFLGCLWSNNWWNFGPLDMYRPRSIRRKDDSSKNISQNR